MSDDKLLNRIWASPILRTAFISVGVLIVDVPVEIILQGKIDWPLHAIIVAMTCWLFFSLMGFFEKLDERMLQLESSYVGDLHPIWKSEPLRKALTRRLSEYQRIEHPLLQELATRDFTKLLEKLHFEERVSNGLNHEEFGFEVAPYIKAKVNEIRALTRSSVTDWRKAYPAGQRYLEAQAGKRVKRIFVIKDKPEYDEFVSGGILLKHCKQFGSRNIFICCQAVADELIKGLPNAIASNQDFAIFDQDIVALCTGDEVRLRADTAVDTCENVFNAVIGQALDYATLKSNPSRVEEMFKAGLNISMLKPARQG
jgi:hypothetical protein